MTGFWVVTVFVPFLVQELNSYYSEDSIPMIVPAKDKKSMQVGRTVLEYGRL